MDLEQARANYDAARENSRAKYQAWVTAADAEQAARRQYQEATEAQRAAHLDLIQASEPQPEIAGEEVVA